jgi:hypothetical protein
MKAVIPPSTAETQKTTIGKSTAMLDAPDTVALRPQVQIKTRVSTASATDDRTRACEDDVRFHTAQGLPGGRTEIALLHHAIDGLMLDRLTIPLDTGVSAEDAVAALVERILGPVTE